MASRRHERADRKGKAAPPAGERAAEAASWPRLLPFAALVVATFLAYRPAWHGGLLWDDAAHVTRPHLRTVGGLLRIWLEPGATQQYYPLTHSAFWLQSRLWGDETLGSHLVGIALHLLAALLLYAGLRRLEVPGALLSAAVFALHPVQVESVAWLSELKNTLSGTLFFGAALAYLGFDRGRRRGAYALALGLFVLGLLAKTVVAVLPVALLAALWWRRGRLEARRDVLPLVPFVLLGLSAGLLTAWVEKRFVIGGLSVHFGLDPPERVLLAGKAFWFYLGKLAWPADLVFLYPRWEISRGASTAWLFPAGVALLFVAAWAVRERWRGPLAALVFFGAALLPALGFVDIYPFRFSFVADHFQYLACAGPIALACGVAAAWSGRLGEAPRRALAASAVLLCGVLALLSSRQSRIYADAETLWRATVERNPSCWLAWNNLGVLALERGNDGEAERLFSEALRLNPGYEAALNNAGFVLARRGRAGEAIGYYERALAVWPAYPDAHVNLGNALFVTGKPGEAVGHYEKAIAQRPDLLEPRNNLALALVATGRPAEAAAHFESALGLARERGLAPLATQIEGHLARCREGRPLVEPGP
ncbi:MAG: tetratricopeptide repeat protein [Holophagales bacterium]|nr:tetratricopeptide repeat protein [Holophagales bacterium]MBK9966382.1 tetratricopeptide repeat protein [Holophagales bacterium]